MSRKRANMTSGALSGAATGAAAGSAAGPWGALIGAGAGGIIGAFGGAQAADADAPWDELDMEGARLDLRMGQRNFRNAMMQDRGQAAFRKYLGAAFQGMRPQTFEEAMR